MSAIKSLSNTSDNGDTPSIWKQIVEYLPLLTICLIIISTAYDVAYFDAFNISILDFIPYTECVRSFVLLGILIAFISGMLIGFKSEHVKPKSAWGAANIFLIASL